VINRLNGRLNRLEQKRPPPADRFPGWEFLAGERGPAERWLAQQGHANLLEAVAGGERDALLKVFALDEWLAARGHVDAFAAVEAGDTGPAGLEGELREQAKYDRQQRELMRLEKGLVAGEQAVQ
jgi:hypothetical protein